MRKHFVKLAPHRPLARSVSLALDVGRILKQRQHAFFPVLRERMQVEQFVVGGSGIDLEIAGVNHHAQRRVDGQRNAIDQAMRHVDGMNRERADLEALSGANLMQIGIVQQAVLFEFVF